MKYPKTIFRFWKEIKKYIPAMIHKQAIFVLQWDPNLANWNSHAEKKITLHIQRNFAVFTNLLDEHHYVLKKQITQYRTQQYLKTVRLML